MPVINKYVRKTYSILKWYKDELPLGEKWQQSRRVRLMTLDATERKI